MEAWLNRVWYEGAPGGWLLRPFGALFGRVARARRALYAAGWMRARRIGRPVIVVGNLTAGGAGKTPLVAWLARELARSGRRVGIVSRGYGRRGTGVRPVADDDDPALVGDEPLLLRRMTRAIVTVGADRVAAAEHALSLGADIIVADDGLQHLALARDVEIIMVDGVRGTGNGRFLPAGPLRDATSRLDQADAVVMNGGEARVPGRFHMRLAPVGVVPLAAGARGEPLENWRGRSVHGVAAIAHPQRFFDLLVAHGMQVTPHAFPDHHAFSARDLEFADHRPVLMTAKDAVKCRAFASALHFEVPVEASFAAQEAEALVARVLARIAGPDAGTR